MSRPKCIPEICLGQPALNNPICSGLKHDNCKLRQTVDLHKGHNIQTYGRVTKCLIRSQFSCALLDTLSRVLARTLPTVSIITSIQRRHRFTPIRSLEALLPIPISMLSRGIISFTSARQNAPQSRHSAGGDFMPLAGEGKIGYRFRWVGDVHAQ
jgi:hypothetical protein